MPTHRPRQIDRHTVERLLAGEVPAGTRDGPDPLIDHLAALAAPARSDEIADEPEAIEAFRAETQTHATAPRRPRRRTRSLARLLTAKVTIAAFISATTVGGVALAANTSVLPTPFRLPAKTGPTPPPPPTDAAPRTSRPQQNEPGPAGTPSLAPPIEDGAPRSAAPAGPADAEVRRI